VTLDLGSLNIQDPQEENFKVVSSTQRESIRDNTSFAKQESSTQAQIEMPPKSGQ